MVATIESQLSTSPDQFNASHPIFLDPERKSLRVEEFGERLSELRVVRLSFSRAKGSRNGHHTPAA
jgi:hypothetical protein